MQVHHNGGLGRKFFLFITVQRTAHKVAEASVVAALDGELVAVAVVDLFNAARRRAQHPQRQVGLFCRLLPQQCRESGGGPGHFDFLWPGKADDAQPAEGRVQAQFPVRDLLLEKGVVVLCGGKVSGIVDGRKTTKDAVGLMMTKIGG